MDDVVNGRMINLTGPLYAPIHGSFTPRNLIADLHVSAADPNQNVGKKLTGALSKLKSLMEYAAKVHSLNVNTGRIEMRPTGGVVVKQMIELLAFVGLGFFEKMEMKKHVEEIKKLRKQRVALANQEIRILQQRLREPQVAMILEMKKQLPVNHEPSPGFAELLKRAEEIRDEAQKRLDELTTLTGERTGSFMGSAFFDEHFYLLQSLIGRGGKDDFSVSAFGLVNDLPQDNPHDIQIVQEVAKSENALLLNTEAGHKFRQAYIAKLQQKMASLRVTIYYGKISEIIGLTS